MRGKRSDRVGGLIQRELSHLLLTKIKDPRLDLATITNVTLSKDLRVASIFFSVSEGEGRDLDALAGFESAAGYLKRELSRRLDLKYAPALRFVYDKSFDRAAHMNRIFKTIRDEDSARNTDSSDV